MARATAASHLVFERAGAAARAFRIDVAADAGSVAADALAPRRRLTEGARAAAVDDVRRARLGAGWQKRERVRGLDLLAGLDVVVEGERPLLGHHLVDLHPPFVALRLAVLEQDVGFGQFVLVWVLRVAQIVAQREHRWEGNAGVGGEQQRVLFVGIEARQLHTGGVLFIGLVVNPRLRKDGRVEHRLRCATRRGAIIVVLAGQLRAEASKPEERRIRNG